jgi:tripartite ATP-independent transporter DctP family solute receptor
MRTERQANYQEGRKRQMPGDISRREIFRGVGATALLAAGGSLLTACASSSSTVSSSSSGSGASSSAKKVSLRFATAGGVTGPEGAVLQKWADLCESLSKGRIQVKAYVNGELGSQTQTYDSTQSGGLDGTVSASSYLTAISEQMHVFDLPYLFKSPQQMISAIASPAAKTVMASTQKANVQVLALSFSGTRAVISRSAKPPSVPADFKGVKIRTLQDPLYVAEWKAVGAVPTPLDTSDIYLALQRGLIGACDGVASYCVSAKWYEVAKSFTKTGHAYGPDATYMNRNKFLSLDSDAQDIVQKAATQAAAYGTQLSLKLETSALQTMQKAGIAENLNFDAAPFIALTKPVYNQYRAKIGPSIVDGLASA